MNTNFFFPPRSTPTTTLKHPPSQPTQYCPHASTFASATSPNTSDIFPSACLFTGLEGELNLKNAIQGCCNSGPGSPPPTSTSGKNYQVAVGKLIQCGGFCNLTSAGDQAELEFCLWGELGSREYAEMDYACWVPKVDGGNGTGGGGGGTSVMPMIATTYTAEPTVVDVEALRGPVVVTVDASGVHVGPATARAPSNSTATFTYSALSPSQTNGSRSQTSNPVNIKRKLLGFIVLVLLGSSVL